MLDFSTERSDAVDALHGATAIYTEPHVVAELLDRIDWPAGEGIFAVPAAGDGAFLPVALARLSPIPGDHAALARIKGWQVHPGACASARIRIREMLVEMGWTAQDANRGADAMVIEGDFLTHPPADASTRYVCGDPSYLRLQNLPKLCQLLYGEIVPEYARAYTLHAFLDLCTRVMTTDGCLCCISSDRWLFNATSTRLREKIGERAGLSHLARIDPATSF